MSRRSAFRSFSAAFALSATIAGAAFGEMPGKLAEEPKLVYQTDFEQGSADWKPTDPKCWEIQATDDKQGKVYAQTKKKSEYEPPYRSPYNISLLQGKTVGDFQLDVDVKSTHEDYGHRDVCLFFGYQSPSKFYYVHLGKSMDDHANQIFIVNDAARTKISTETTSGTPWTDEWHHVRIVRKAASGEIAVYFDDMNEPAMTAKDASFAWGQVGLGSFDDTSAWDAFKLTGQEVSATAAK